MRKLGQPVALKAEAPGLLHKSDLGCVRLNCATEDEVTDGYRGGDRATRKAAGFAPAGVLVQPMVSGVAEGFAGIIDDPLYGPAIVFGLGGIFVELLNDTVIEMAPLSTDDALRMIHRVKGAQLLTARAAGRAATSRRWPRVWSSSATSRSRTPAASARSISIRSWSSRRRRRRRGRYRDRAGRRHQRGSTMSYKDLIYSVATRSRPSRSTGRIA